MRCKHCGKEHDHETREYKHKPQCILCKGSHNATNRKNCLEFEEQKNIKLKMITENISHLQVKEIQINNYATTVENKGTITVTEKKENSRTSI